MKHLYTRKEFESLLDESARKMASDADLRKKALKLLIRADQFRWIHQTRWMGEPILNLPQDMFALQDIIFRTKPDFIVETGVAWGGSLLFYASLLEIIGHGRVIGVDIYIPDDLRKRLASHGAVSRRLSLVRGSSVEADTLAKIRSMVGASRKVLVILDSYHTHEHVLKELRMYAPLVGKGHYLVCCDTVVEDIPVQKHRSRPWGPGNNPQTAVREFLAGNDRFEVDERIDRRLLLTCNPGGYLRCRKAARPARAGR